MHPLGIVVEGLDPRRAPPGRWSTASLATLGIVLCASSVVLLRLGALQFPSYDGIWHVFIARQESWSSFWREVMANAHPPLFYLLLGGAIKALGNTFLAYRAVSIVATLVSALLVARIVAALTSNRWLGVVAAAAFGLSSNAVEIGLEVRAYSLCTCLMLAASSLYVDWLATGPGRFPSWKRGLFAGALTASLLTNYSAFFLLAATMAVPGLLFLARRRWRVRLRLEATRHRAAAALMFGVPLLVGVAMYLLHARRWARGLSHVSEFMYDSRRETVWDFLAHAARNLVLIALPPFGKEPGAPMVVASLMVVGAALLLSRRDVWGRPAVVPLLLLGVMLGLNLVAGVAGRYPFGGAMRQEFFLFPFAIIALFTGIDAIRRLLRRPWSATGPWAGVAALGVAASFGSWISEVQIANQPMMYEQHAVFREAMGPPAAVLVDQYNFIMYFGLYHDWDWHLDWQDLHRSPWQAWQVSKAGQRFTVFRSRSWLLDFSRPEAFAEAAACVRRVGPVSVFRPQQYGVRATWATEETGRFAGELGPDVGIAPTKVVVRGEDVFLAFQAATQVTAGRGISVVEATYGSSCGAPRGNATGPIKRECDGSASCAFLVRVEEIGDPVPGCLKDFTVAWTCNQDGPRQQTNLGAEAGFGSVARLTCGK